MTEPTRAKATRRPRRSASQLFIAALVVFGIAASVLLLFSENVQWLRVGLVSALWAAIVGAFAMTKYRREAVADQAKAKDLQTVYELQLAREISARREYELGVEARVRSEVQLETNEVAALRVELAHLRENLQLLFDGNLPAERLALRADATRVQELGGRNYSSYQAAASGLYVPGGGSQPTDSTDVQSEPVPGLATPFDDPVTAETSVLYPDVPIGSEDPASGFDTSEFNASGYKTSSYKTSGYDSSGYTASGYETTGNAGTERRSSTPNRRESEQATRIPGSRRPAPTPPRTPTAPLVSEPVGAPAGRAPIIEPTAEPFTSEPEAVYEAQPEAVPVPDAVEPEPVSQSPSAESEPEPEPEPEPADDPTPAARGRRRRAEPEVDAAGAHSNGRSVAEIMAGLQSGADEPPARRHRRRAE